MDKWTNQFGTQDNWKNENPWSRFGERPLEELPTKQHCLKIGPNWPNQQCCLAGSSKTAPRIVFFQLSWVSIIHFMWNPLLLVPSHFLGILFQSYPVWRLTLLLKLNLSTQLFFSLMNPFLLFLQATLLKITLIAKNKHLTHF